MMSKPANFIWPIADLSEGDLPFTILQRLYSIGQNSKGDVIKKHQQGKLANIQNLDPVLNKIATSLGLTFTPEKETEGEVCFINSPELRPGFRQAFALIDVLDYIYAVLHSPGYREKYKDFLKMDSLEVPYPTDTDAFWKLVAHGAELRQLHSSTL